MGASATQTGLSSPTEPEVSALRASIPSAWTAHDEAFWQGYRDGRDPNAPEPSTNRSHCYRHSFAVGRAEINGSPILASVSRERAAEAEALDTARSERTGA